MQLFAFGLNHETATVEASEAFALDAAAQQAVYQAVTLDPKAELILLSTCNRTEAYLYGTAQGAARVRQLLSRHARQPWPEGADFERIDEAAVRHVLHVASGMHSLVPGDNQILAQVKEAYRRAVDADAVGMVLHRLMHTAFRAAKRVATETDLASGAASISTAAVAMACSYFEARTPRGFAGQRVLLVGAGQMGRLALSALRKYDLASVTVTNRSPERARCVAEAMGGCAAPWAARHAAVREADLVIVATGADAPVLTVDAVPPRSLSDAASALIIDIARPRNVDPAVGCLPGYEVRDLDDLQVWTEEVQTARHAALPRAEAICDELLGDFVSWVFHQEALQPAIQAIRETFESIRTQEIARHAHRFSGADEEELDKITRSILQKVLAVPIVRLKNVNPESIDYGRGIRLLSALFSRPETCDEEPPKGDVGAESASPRLAAAPANAPAQCPFETHQSSEAFGDMDRLREALRDPAS